MNFILIPVLSLFIWQAPVSPVVQLVNEERVEQGLQPLRENEELNEAAELKLNDMVSNDYFSHESPNDTSPWHWFKEAGYDYRYAGENLARNFTNTEKQHESWMNSEKHRENILSEKYTETGVATNGVITVQLFGSK